MNGIQARMEARLTKDPELRYSNNDGTPYVNVGAAVNYYAPPGEPRETIYLDLILFRQQAEFCASYAKRGNRVYIEGQLSFETYTRRDGAAGYRHTLKCRDFILCESSNAADAPDLDYADAEPATESAADRQFDDAEPTD